MTPATELKDKMTAFKLAVIWMPCAACGTWPPPGIPGWRAHHVVYKQHLPVEHHWDPRNALPVCDEPWGRCHGRHHRAVKRIPLDALTDENREFASEVLGEAAEYYLKRYYEFWRREGVKDG